MTARKNELAEMFDLIHPDMNVDSKASDKLPSSNGTPKENSTKSTRIQKGSTDLSSS